MNAGAWILIAVIHLTTLSDSRQPMALYRSSTECDRAAKNNNDVIRQDGGQSDEHYECKYMEYEKSEGTHK